MEEFNLSEKIEDAVYMNGSLSVSAVKEFIRLLKEILRLDEEEKFMSSFVVKNWINKLAGDKLI
jgi:hypothetical protein